MFPRLFQVEKRTSAPPTSSRLREHVIKINSYILSDKILGGGKGGGQWLETTDFELRKEGVCHNLNCDVQYFFDIYTVYTFCSLKEFTI